MTIILILATLFALLLIGVPVAFALGGMGLGMLLIGGFSPLMAPASDPVDAGRFHPAGGAAVSADVQHPAQRRRRARSVRRGACLGRALARRAGGGHDHFLRRLFAAISGSSVATAATIGTVAIPEMIIARLRQTFRIRPACRRRHAGDTDPAVDPDDRLRLRHRTIGDRAVPGRDRSGPGAGRALHRLFHDLHARLSGGYHPGSRQPPWANGATAGIRAPALDRAWPLLVIGGHLLRRVHADRGGGDRLCRGAADHRPCCCAP